MFCLESYQGHIIDILIVHLSYPQDSINTKVIYQFGLTRVECTSYFLFRNCKQILRHCHSWLAGQQITCVLILSAG